MDISTKDLKKHSANYDDLLYRLIIRSRGCKNISPTTCDLEILRKNFYLSRNSDSTQSSTCTNQNCTQQLPTACPSSPFIQYYCNVSEYSTEDQCCSCWSPGHTVIVAVFSSWGLLMTIVIVASIITHYYYDIKDIKDKLQNSLRRKKRNEDTELTPPPSYESATNNT